MKTIILYSAFFCLLTITVWGQHTRDTLASTLDSTNWDDELRQLSTRSLQECFATLDEGLKETGWVRVVPYPLETREDSVRYCQTAFHIINSEYKDTLRYTRKISHDMDLYVSFSFQRYYPTVKVGQDVTTITRYTEDKFDMTSIQAFIKEKCRYHIGKYHGRHTPLGVNGNPKHYFIVHKDTTYYVCYTYTFAW